MNVQFPSVSIVLLGQFRPDDFLPIKLAEGKAITKKAAESASFITLVPSQVVHFNFGWGELQVIPKRFHITTKAVPYIRISDLAIKALRDLSPDSLVSAFGINLEHHYEFPNADARNSLGMRIAPPAAWGAWGAELLANIHGEKKGTPLQGGLLSMQMRLPFLNNGISGWQDVVVGPSSAIQEGLGVLLRSNHHHQIVPLTFDGLPESEGPTEREATSRLLEALAEGFDNSIASAESIFQGVLAL